MKKYKPFTNLLPFQKVSISTWRRFWSPETDAHTRIEFVYFGPIAWTGICETDGTYLFEREDGTELHIHPEWGISNYKVAEVYDLDNQYFVSSNLPA